MKKVKKEQKVDVKEVKVKAEKKVEPKKKTKEEEKTEKKDQKKEYTAKKSSDPKVDVPKTDNHPKLEKKSAEQPQDQLKTLESQITEAPSPTKVEDEPPIEDVQTSDVIEGKKDADLN